MSADPRTLTAPQADQVAVVFRNLALACTAAVGVGLLVLAALAGRLTGALVAGGAAAAGAWLYFAFRRPVTAFGVVAFTFALAHARLYLGMVSVAGPLTSNRGVLRVGDFVLAGLLAAVLLRYVLNRDPKSRNWAFEAASPLSVWATLPFLALATVLPLSGYLAGTWPASFAVPGLRQIQWVGTALAAYVLAKEFGTRLVLRVLFAALIAAGALHVAYGSVQLLNFLGVLGAGWVAWDALYAVHHNVGWFFYPRLTGLLVNPNSYGFYGAFLFVLGAALVLTRAPHGLRIWVAVASAIFALAMTGSRSALLGLVIAALMVGFVTLRSDQMLGRLAKFSIGLPLVLAAAVGLLWPLIPSILQSRYRRLFAVLIEGTDAEPNAAARLQMWQEAWQRYWTDHPLGTWVPPSYALELPIDSYYLVTAMQGTPVFTALWLLFALGLTCLGWQAMRRAESALERAAGLTLIGWVGVILGGSFTLSPLPQPQLAFPLWALAGCVLAIAVRANEGDTRPGPERDRESRPRVRADVIMDGQGSG